MDGLSRLLVGNANGSVTGGPGVSARPAVISGAGTATARRGTPLFLESPRIADVAKMINAVIQKQQQQQQRRIVLILDQPDVLLAAAAAGDGVNSGSLRDLVLDLREVSAYSADFHQVTGPRHVEWQ